MNKTVYSKIDLRGVPGADEITGIFCHFVCDDSVRCAHISQSYNTSHINYLCQCDPNRPAAQDKKPTRMNIVAFMRNRKLQENYHGVRLQHSIAGVEGWGYE